MFSTFGARGTSVIIERNEFAFYCSGDFVTQLPFELKIAMPEPDRGKRGYSDEYIAAAQSALLGS